MFSNYFISGLHHIFLLECKVKWINSTSDAATVRKSRSEKFGFLISGLERRAWA
jgi:hypothetical protein